MSREISDAAKARGISEIVHFSTNMGLTGSLHTGLLLPRNKLRTEEQLEHILTLNAKFRTEEQPWFDRTQNWINFINLSISRITRNLFQRSLSWHAGKDIFWVIMAFSVDLLDDEGVFFSTTNNIYSGTTRRQGLSGFNALFASTIHQYGGKFVTRGETPNHFTTDEQAEALYPDGLSMNYLQRIYARTGEETDRIHALLGQFGREDVEVILAPDKFRG